MIYAFCGLTALCTAVICAACFGGGYLLGRQGRASAPRVKTEDTQRLNREARIKQIEMQNFWSYNGDEQQDPAQKAEL